MTIFSLDISLSTRRMLCAVCCLIMPAISLAADEPRLAQPTAGGADGRLVQVGPLRPLRNLSMAASYVRDGDTIELDAGEYHGDVAVWTRDNLTIRAVGGRARLFADGSSAEGKGIWVMRRGSLQVEKIDFVGARVGDKNGAGIRFEKGRLVVRDCLFTDNENGILTGNDGSSELVIEGSEFGNNGAGDGRSHNLYVGSIRRLTVTGSYFHHARAGHLLKSRAAENHILYNRLTDEIGGRASYELEFANGGIAYVIGNVIQQSSSTENSHIISYGAEGYGKGRNEFYLINNTIADNRPQGGIFLSVKRGAHVVRAANNLLVGKGSLEAAGPGDYRNNLSVDWNEFVLAAREDYRLAANSKLVGKGVRPEPANGVDLVPQREYLHPRQTRDVRPRQISPGAMQSVGAKAS